MDELLRRLRLREIGQRSRWVTAIVTALVIGTGTIAVGLAIPSADGRIFGCYSAKDGALRLVPEGEACDKSELSIFWNQTGPPGPKGDTGAQGPKGDTGPAGGGGIASLESLNGLSCNTPAGVAGTTRVIVADGNVSIVCEVPRPGGAFVRPVFSSVTVSGNLATVVFSEPVCRESPFASSDWTVISNATPVVSIQVLGESIPTCDSGDVVATANLAFPLEVPSGAFVGVTLNGLFFGSAGPFADSDGNPIEAPQTRTATATRPETTRPTLLSATATLGSRTLTLTFSEPVYCGFSLMFTASDFTISDDDAATDDLMVTGPGANQCASTQLTADLSFSVTTHATFLLGRNYTVTLTPEFNEIQDVVGNDLQPTDRPIVLN